MLCKESIWFYIYITDTRSWWFFFGGSRKEWMNNFSSFYEFKKKKTNIRIKLILVEMVSFFCIKSLIYICLRCDTAVLAKECIFVCFFYTLSMILSGKLTSSFVSLNQYNKTQYCNLHDLNILNLRIKHKLYFKEINIIFYMNSWWSTKTKQAYILWIDFF
jgi:hypothetical protein